MAEITSKMVDGVKVWQVPRKLLAEGTAINPTHFALSDDGVDYSLWNTSSPSGSGGYDDFISKLPMIEAVSDDKVMMKYTLATLPQTTRYLPVVSILNSHNTNNSFTLSNDSDKKKLLNWKLP